MTTKPLCIYHGGCDDGFAAAYAVWRRFGDDVDFHPGVYQTAPPDVTGRDVIMVDFSYKPLVLAEMAESAETILILDHHKSAAETLCGLPATPWGDWNPAQWSNQAAHEGVPAVFAHFDMEASGAMMAWRYFHKTPAPDFFHYIQDRDLWRHEFADTFEFSMALRSYPHDLGIWRVLVEGGVKRLVEEGVHIARYYRRQIEALKPNAETAVIRGYNVPVCNAPYAFASDLAGELAVGHPFAATYFKRPDGWQFSLRSRDHGIDVSEVAAAFGGGGHRGAAGFMVDFLDDIVP
ncbi:MAG: DHHA1 domain-containing protein [Minwuiales bacterium]|nr:DHHA1 domain-containing protein [Minwuiales bacterium]